MPKSFVFFTGIIVLFVKKNTREDFFKHATRFLKDQVADSAPDLHFLKRPFLETQAHIPSTLRRKECRNGALFFIFTVRRSVYTNPSRKTDLKRTLYIGEIWRTDSFKVFTKFSGKLFRQNSLQRKFINVLPSCNPS